MNFPTRATAGAGSWFEMRLETSFLQVDPSLIHSRPGGLPSQQVG